MVPLQIRMPQHIKCTACAAGQLCCTYVWDGKCTNGLYRPCEFLFLLQGPVFQTCTRTESNFMAMQARLVHGTSRLNACKRVPESLLSELHLCCRRTKTQYIVDFENLPELPDNAFELAPHKDISLKAMPAVNTLLPQDHHYKVCLSCCLSQCQQPSVQMLTAERNLSASWYACGLLLVVCLVGCLFLLCPTGSAHHHCRVCLYQDCSYCVCL